MLQLRNTEAVVVQVRSVLQCVAVCCRVLQCVAVCCEVLQCFTVRCSVVLVVQIRIFTQNHGAGVNKSRDMHECDMLHASMRHVTCINE